MFHTLLIEPYMSFAWHLLGIYIFWQRGIDSKGMVSPGRRASSGPGGCGGERRMEISMGFPWDFAWDSAGEFQSSIHFMVQKLPAIC